MVQGVLVTACGDDVEDNFHYFYVCPLFNKINVYSETIRGNRMGKSFGKKRKT
jgi:hypothetical protein